ncbi:MAG TPA: LPS export ABC transporter periplasmic protein LptC [Burkholderiales bacterium]|nr:LPS export ABC transporter periplasmic protein LptC [Burkholderiales bacterium]
MIKDRLIAWSPAILLLLLVVLTWWLDARVRVPDAQLVGAGESDPEFYIEGFMAVRMNPDGSRRYELAGTRLTHYGDRRGSLLDSPSLLYYDYERAPLTVNADTAEVEGGGENVYFRGNVTVARPAYGSNPELGLATTYLHVIPDTEIARTDQPVTMTEGNSTARSVGLEFDNKAAKIRLLSTVQTHYETRRSRNAKTQSDTR